MNLNKIFSSKAPARVCLYGDHQDYLGLPVIACAINKYIHVEGKKNKSKILSFHLVDLKRTVSICIDKISLKPIKGDHIGFVLYTLYKLGCQINTGMTIKIKSNIYINAGISSSSALVVSLVDFFTKSFVFPKKVDKKLIAEIAFKSEVIEQKGSGGRMDQYTIAISNTIFLETQNNGKYELLDNPFSSIIVANSGIKKETDFDLRRLKIKTLSVIDKIKNLNSDFDLKKVLPSELITYSKFLDHDSYDILYAAVHNYKITIEAYKELKKKKPKIDFLLSKINEHHQILKNKLKITIPKIDNMISKAFNAGALGAKIIGSGGGGSIMVIAKKDFEHSVIKSLQDSGCSQVSKVKILKDK